MIRAIIEQTFDQQKKYVVLAGLSTDSKPTTGIITGSKFYEVNTGIEYAFDEVGGSWSAIGLSPAEIKAEIDAWLDEHPEATTTVEDGAISYAKLDSSLQALADKVPDLKTEMQSKANIDGYYEQMTVGNAEQLVSTVGVEDKVPYLFRTSGGSADIGDREVDEIIGGTIAWNQLVPTESRNFTNTTTESVLSINFLFRLNASPYTIFYNKQTSETMVNFAFIAKATATGKAQMIHNGQQTQQVFAHNIDVVNGHAYLGMLNFTSNDITTVGGLVVKDIQLFDLTQMFGSTIADYIYTLESANAGAGVSYFRNLFPKPYYAYDAGTLMSVCANKHRTVGFNAWDEEWKNGRLNLTTGEDTSGNGICSKNYTPVVPSTVYHAVSGSYSGAVAFLILYYDASKNYISYDYKFGLDISFTTPANAHYIRFNIQTSAEVTAYNHDICINLHWDGERDGEYEPYVVHEYALDDVELRGIPKLDTNNKLYYDGDTYESDGTVTRRYGIVTIDNNSTIGQHQAGSTRFYLTLNDLPRLSDYVGAMVCDILPVHSTCESEPNTEAFVSGYPINSSYPGQNWIYFSNGVSTTSSDMKTWLASHPITIVYELATPTTESADPYSNPQIVDDFGTEEYVDALATAQTSPRNVAIPVGHNTRYQNNLRAKLEMSPESPSGDGDYIVRQSNGENVYVQLTFPADELPASPTTDGTYRLVCTVEDGTATFTWEEVTE